MCAKYYFILQYGIFGQFIPTNLRYISQKYVAKFAKNRIMIRNIYTQCIFINIVEFMKIKDNRLSFTKSYCAISAVRDCIQIQNTKSLYFLFIF